MELQCGPSDLFVRFALMWIFYLTILAPSVMSRMNIFTKTFAIEENNYQGQGLFKYACCLLLEIKERKTPDATYHRKQNTNFFLD